MKTLPTPEQIEDAKAILQMAMETPSDVADVFVEFVPHCDCLDVRVFGGGWMKDAEPTARRNLYLSRDCSKEMRLWLSNAIAYIRAHPIDKNASKLAIAANLESRAKQIRAEVEAA